MSKVDETVTSSHADALQSDTPPSVVDPPPIHITATAKSKAHRMFAPWQLHAIAGDVFRGSGGHIYRKGDSNEYHALIDDYAVVIRVETNAEYCETPHEDTTLIIITQMHQHIDYESDGVFEPVPSIRESGGFYD